MSFFLFDKMKNLRINDFCQDWKHILIYYKLSIHYNCLYIITDYTHRHTIHKHRNVSSGLCLHAFNSYLVSNHKASERCSSHSLTGGESINRCENKRKLLPVISYNKHSHVS